MSPPAEARLVGSIILGADEFIAQWVRARVERTQTQNIVAMGVVRRGELVAGVVYQNCRGHDIEVVIAADRADWALPGTLRALFAYPFITQGCVRITAVIGRKNDRSRKFCKGLGFKEEGCIRRAIDGREDAMIYGMLREECKFLRVAHGQENRHAAGAGNA